MPAPIALFVYNRLWHTRQTITSLAANVLADQTDLIIFSDGPKRDSNIGEVGAVRNFLKKVTGFKSVQIIESDSNKGLANSIISGVSTILGRFEEVIVIEDDLVTSPYFLSYINSALSVYKNDNDVISIHGYVYPVSSKLPETFFLRGADCWGWATWRRGWELLETDGQKLLNQLKERKLTREFDFDGNYPYTRMLEKQIRGQNDSWAIRWYASAFLQNKLTLYPGRSLVQNIGNDSSGTHSRNSDRFDHSSLAGETSVKRLVIREDMRARKVISDYLKSSAHSLWKKVISRINLIAKRCIR
jgi:hypothetical protein